MVEPITLSAAITLLVKSAPTWLDTLRGILVDEGKGLVIEQGKSRLREYFDKKKQLRHLELALKNAAERGLAQFQTEQDRDRYRHVLTILSDVGSHHEALRRETMRLFTLSESPHLEDLNEIYNRSLRIQTVSKGMPTDEVNITVYLKSFFEALMTELYVDTMFHEQLSDALKVRAGISMQRSLKDVLATLHLIGEAIIPTYSMEQFEQDVQTYTEYLERTLHYLKLLVIVPQDRVNENIDPELNGIFVPLRLVSLNYINSRKLASDSLVSLLEQASCLVLLGSPGSGKSISTRHLAWSHAAANLHSLPVINSPMLSGIPLPLRIELRQFVEARRQHPEYSFFSYFTDVLLKRENISINIQMFQELLERRTMLLIFDGLDEVDTLEERLRLIEEIEHLITEYPGNRILVTSRPVGYEYAHFSSRWFSHAQIQEFNDAQIHMFLERWYMHVLRYAPIPSQEKQELEELYKTLKERPRLHILAKNPLLLSVISALHRSKRLPDRRVLVYEECTKILLEIWSQYRGTDIHWKDLLMTEEDQRACIAHLGFALHKRFQEELNKTDTKRVANVRPIVEDVPATYLLREIESFLESQNLFTSVAEQRAEAKLFFKMIQLETGLIVETGTNEDGEALYGFIHRTFQEYFAAMDVYERYQREEDTSIIRNFLQTYLYDPHWHEVLLLLLGKLKRKPVTIQLLQILDGKIIDQLNIYREILHNDLFFISFCLAEEISVENHFSTQVIQNLKHLIVSSPFPSQRSEVLEALISLKSTRQYGEIAHNALLDLLTQNSLADLTRMQVAQVVYLNSSLNSKEQIQARQILMEMVSSSAIPFKFAENILGRLYFSCAGNLEKQQHIGLMLYQFVQRPITTFDEALSFYHGMLYAESDDRDILPGSPLVKSYIEFIKQPTITLEQMAEAAQSLYLYTESETEENKLATQMLCTLLQQTDLSQEQLGLIARTLYRCSITFSEEKRIATQILLKLAKDPHIPIELVGEIAKTIFYYQTSKYHLYQFSNRDEEYSQILQILRNRLRQPILSFEENLLINEVLCKITHKDSEEHQQALQKLSRLSQQPNITFEQRVRATKTFIENSPSSSTERERAIESLITLLEHPNLSVEQILYLAQTLYRYSQRRIGLQEVEILFDPRIKQTLYKIIQRPDISFDQMLLVIRILYKDENPLSFFEREGTVTVAESIGGAFEKHDERLLAKQIMSQLLEKPNLTDTQRLQLVTIPLTTKFPNIADLAHSIRMIISILHDEAAREYIKKHLPMVVGDFLYFRYEIDISDLPFLVELAEQEALSVEFREAMYKLLRQVFPLYWVVNKPRDPYVFSEEID